MGGFLLIWQDQEDLPIITETVQHFEIPLPFLGVLYWKESLLKEDRDTGKGKMKMDERLILKSNNLE